MKQINNFIIEKLRINKDTKVNNKFIQEILEFLFSKPSDADPKEVKIFQEWIKEYNIEHMTIICSKKDLQSYYVNTDVKEVIDAYKNNDEVDLILQDNTFTDIGEEVYVDKDECVFIFINKTSNWMLYHAKDVADIYFVPKKISKEEAAKYTSK